MNRSCINTNQVQSAEVDQNIPRNANVFKLGVKKSIKETRALAEYISVTILLGRFTRLFFGTFLLGAKIPREN